MPLTPEENSLRIQRLGGQAGRNPIGSLQPGRASHSEGASHHAEFLTRARGTKKVTRAPVPKSAYELHGIATGILEFPAVKGYEAAWVSVPAAASPRSWSAGGWVKPLAAGRLQDLATGDGQIFFSTGAQIGAHPNGGSDINTVRLSLVAPGGVYTLRARWGTGEYDIPLEDTLNVPFDPEHWLGFSVTMTNGNPNATMSIACAVWDGPGIGDVRAISAFSQAAARGWHVNGFWFGGSPVERKPVQGIESPCYCLVADVVVSAATTSNSPPGASSSTVTGRLEDTPVATATTFMDYWNLTEATDTPQSAGGRSAYLVGNRVTRDTGITTEQGGALRFDGSGMLIIENSDRLREAPKTRAQGGVEGHYLELPDWTLGFCFAPRRWPFRGQSVERATLACWSTPWATNLGGGVASDPLIGTYPDNNRPSEHLRVDLIRDGTTWYLEVYFGDLEPNSLKHPTGTAGGQSTTAWPPALSTAGEPPATWNKPHDDPAAAYGDADGKAAFRVELGDDGDATHPMDYGWWVFLQKTFTAQSDAANACGVFVHRVTTAGAYDTTFTEAVDANADSDGLRHPANQSCFAAARLNGSDINFRPDSYILSIGGAAGSRFGDEGVSYDATNRDPMCYPIDDALRRFQLSDEGDNFTFVGKVSSLFFLRRWLQANDRLKIGESGVFGSAMRVHFGDDVLMSMNFEEPDGTVLRDARGNDIGYSTKIGLAPLDNDLSIEQPQIVGAYPRPEPVWNGAADQFAGESAPVNGIVQRIDSQGAEEIYVIAQAGLYELDRDTYGLTRVASLPGQGGPGQVSAVVDTNDVIHIAGGAGRPVVVTRDRVVAVSGIDPPHYSAPQAIVYGTKSITGGLSITFQTKSTTAINSLVGYELDDTSTCQFAIGYWSDTLKTRSRPGPIVTCRYIDAQFNSPSVTSPPTIIRYRMLVSGLPPPRGPNASSVTHWEIYRTDSNGNVLILEKRIPINDQPVAVMIGDLPLGTGEEADFFRDVPPEGLKALTVFGDRVIGVSPPEFPRNVVWTKRRDPMNWPPLYSASMNQTNAPATGCVIRRGRAFPFSLDHLYQLIESTIDASLAFGSAESLSLDTVAEGVGGLSHQAAITDHENGIYLPGTKSVYLTEGGTFRSLTVENDSAGAAGGDDFSWPDSWDISDPKRFVSFHDERLRMVGVCGPSSDDSDRIDALCIFYERAQIAADGRSFMAIPDCSRLKGIDARCVANILNVATGRREVWFGTQLGFVVKFGEGTTINVDYEGLDDITPKVGQVLAVPSTTTLWLEHSVGGIREEGVAVYPTTDVFRGAMLRCYRDGEMVLEAPIQSVDAGRSWVVATMAEAHGVLPGDSWTIGAIPIEWRSGKMDGGDLLRDIRLQSVDLTMNE